MIKEIQSATEEKLQNKKKMISGGHGEKSSVLNVKILNEKVTHRCKSR